MIYILSLIFTLPIVSCTTDDDTFVNMFNGNTKLTRSSEIDIDNADICQEIKDKINYLGFDTTNIQRIDSFIVVEGDIVFNENRLLELTLTRQYRTNFYYQSDEPIRIGFSRAFADSLLWKNAILGVIDNYNEATGLNFIYDNVNPDITIYRDVVPGVYGSGEFPLSNDKPGQKILINTDYNYLNDSQKLYILMHEVGHNLGLRHTDCKTNNESEGEGWIKIPGTPDNDPNSYMISQRSDITWGGFSEGDAIALDYLWPKTYMIYFDGSRPEIKIKLRKTESYYLPYNIIPTMNVEGKDFQEWHHHPTVYTPLNYGTPIRSDMYLYPRWIDKREKKTFVMSTQYTAVGEIRMDRVAPVIVKCRIRRGLNTWGELQSVDGTYIKIERELDEFSYSLNFRNYVSALLTGEEYSLERTIYMTPGDYDISLSFTKELGEQNGASGKHGWIEVSIIY